MASIERSGKRLREFDFRLAVWASNGWVGHSFTKCSCFGWSHGIFLFPGNLSGSGCSKAASSYESVQSVWKGPNRSKICENTGHRRSELAPGFATIGTVPMLLVYPSFRFVRLRFGRRNCAGQRGSQIAMVLVPRIQPKTRDEHKRIYDLPKSRVLPAIDDRVGGDSVNEPFYIGIFRHLVCAARFSGARVMGQPEQGSNGNGGIFERALLVAFSKCNPLVQNLKQAGQVSRGTAHRIAESPLLGDEKTPPLAAVVQIRFGKNGNAPANVVQNSSRGQRPHWHYRKFCSDPVFQFPVAAELPTSSSVAHRLGSSS